MLTVSRAEAAAQFQRLSISRNRLSQSVLRGEIGKRSKVNMFILGAVNRRIVEFRLEHEVHSRSRQQCLRRHRTHCVPSLRRRKLIQLLTKLDDI